MKYGVQFGAGNIGRGFIGHLLWESGFRTIFVEANQELVKLLNEKGRYPLRLLDKDGTAHDLLIDRIEALSSEEEDRVIDAVGGAEIVFTAVGVKNLQLIARTLARGIEKRFRANPQFLNVFLCENLKDAPVLLRKEVEAYLSPLGKDFCQQKVGFVGTVVARMVPVIGERYGINDPLLIVAESYHKLPFDVGAVRGSVPSISGLKPASDFQAEVDKKLFLHNLGHAVLAYVGYLKKYAYIHEAIHDPEVEGILGGVWEEVTRSLFHKYPAINRTETKEMVQDLKERFANPALMDTVERVGREPLRKLKPDDRLVGGIHLCLSQGIFPRFIAMACGAALHYDFSGDPEAVMLQEMIIKKGVKEVIKEVCALDPESEIGKEVLASYHFWLHTKVR
ncbi:MAG: hypothetical protein ABDK94_01620 [Atribacterota bacterium]